MKKIQIIKNNIVTNEADGSQFASESKLMEWLDYHIANHSFGKPARFESILNVETNEVESVEVEPAEAFEVIITDITAELEAQAAKEAKIQAGKKAREVCQKVLDFVAGENLDKSLTIEQITQMQTIFANAEAALRAGRPTFAKAFISAIEPDGTLVSAEVKAVCLELLADY